MRSGSALTVTPSLCPWIGSTCLTDDKPKSHTAVRSRLLLQGEDSEPVEKKSHLTCSPRRLGPEVAGAAEVEGSGPRAPAWCCHGVRSPIHRL